MINTNNLRSHGEVIAKPNDKNTFRRYENDISKYKPFSREEEIEMFIRIENGDEIAFQKICNHNLRFVISVAKRYAVLLGSSSTLTLEDLISEGNTGLVIPVNKFNYRDGNKFISYAVWWIKQYVLSSIQNNVKNIRIPISVRSQTNKINRQEQKLTQKLERQPTSLEVFEAMVADGEMNSFIEKYTIDELNKMSGYEVSLSTLIGTDSTIELGEMISDNELDPSDVLIRKQRHQFLMGMLDNIPVHAKNCIIDYYGIDTKQLTLKEIGVKYNLTSESIRQTIKRHIRNLNNTNKKNVNFFFPNHKSNY